jgi:3-oxoacyl-[acyl-carrier protein] reductase
MIDDVARCTVVAGGSGGLGSAICDAFARRGDAVAVLYRSRADAAEAVVTRLRDFGVAAASWQLDLEDADTATAAVEDIVRRFGGIKTAVYAAGPPFAIDYLTHISPADFTRVLNADAISCFNFLQAVLPALRKSRDSVIGITTEQLERLELRGALSSVPKAAVDKLFEVVAKEEARYGVRAVTLRCGWIDVGLGADALESKFPPEAVKALIGSIPLRRFGLPREVGAIAAFLASADAGYVTGVSIPVNGGRHL